LHISQTLYTQGGDCHQYLVKAHLKLFNQYYIAIWDEMWDQVNEHFEFAARQRLVLCSQIHVGRVWWPQLMRLMKLEYN